MPKEEINPIQSDRDSTAPAPSTSLPLGRILDFLEEEGYTGGSFASVDLPGIEKDKHFNPAKRMKEDPDSLCFAHVLEESLKDLGVRIGDVLCIDKTAVPMIGDIVVADVDGPVVRRFHHENGVYELRPENPHMETIRSTDSASLEIWGVVKKVMRAFKWDGNPDFDLKSVVE